MVPQPTGSCPLFWQVAIAALLLCSGCTREYTDTPQHARYTGSEPWTVEGIRPGQSFDPLLQRFGEPRDSREHNGIRVVRWATTPVIVTVGRDGRVAEVLGGSLRAGARTLAWSGITEAEVEQILGPGQASNSRRPKGNGVISTGSVLVGRTLRYENDGVLFDIDVHGNTAGRVRAHFPTEPVQR